MPDFTARQAEGWEEHVKPILERHGIPSHTPFQMFGHWHIEWGDEIRPGRGHHFNGLYGDGEHFVQVLMDVYGYPSVSIATLDWIHADSDEELVCDICHKHKMYLSGRDDDGRMVFECEQAWADCQHRITFNMWGDP